mmetsp:Transcript_34821/g.104951  ORF Transcript_34821/g.104951 Transcript_34821/m.104951 type:complete len:262 (-) Transcript_34821:98-883(-)
MARTISTRMRWLLDRPCGFARPLDGRVEASVRKIAVLGEIHERARVEIAVAVQCEAEVRRDVLGLKDRAKALIKHDAHLLSQSLCFILDTREELDVIAVHPALLRPPLDFVSRRAIQHVLDQAEHFIHHRHGETEPAVLWRRHNLELVVEIVDNSTGVPAEGSSCFDQVGKEVIAEVKDVGPTPSRQLLQCADRATAVHGSRHALRHAVEIKLARLRVDGAEGCVGAVESRLPCRHNRDVEEVPPILPDQVRHPGGHEATV